MTGIQRFPKLFCLGCIGKLEIKNRVVMAPMETSFIDPDKGISERGIHYYAARAKGGVGLIITEANKVEWEIDKSPAYHVGSASSDDLIMKMTDLVDAVHDYGAKICLQITPGIGRNQDRASPDNVPVSASAVPALANPEVLCRPLTIEEIRKIVQACAEAARRAKTAGFDMIEIHSHYGYLLDQFMTALWNKRSDQYGGDIQGRMHFPLEIIKAIRAEVGTDFPISFRFSAEHKIDGGCTLTEAKERVPLLEAAGINALHVDVGCYESMPLIFPPIYLPQGSHVDLAAAVKSVATVPVITVGGITRPEFAEQILEEGRADFVCLGRQLIADPDWPNKAEEGRAEDIIPCIRCNEYCIQRWINLKPISCSVNPTVGKERYYTISRTGKPKKVMVIGGGPAGMEAARIAALRGHEVTLYEKDDELGGQLIAASKASFKREVRELIDYLSVQLGKLGVKVELGEKVTPLIVDTERPEAVVIATGATPLMPPISGIESEKIITAVDFELGKKKVGNTVIVAGGGLVGLEAALSLSQEGKKVTVIEMLPNVAYDVNLASQIALLSMLTEKGGTILANMIIKEFTTEGLIATDKEGKQQTFKADTIVLALGAKSENKLAEDLKDKVSELYMVGDCVSPRRIGEAIHEGFVAGWRI